MIYILTDNALTGGTQTWMIRLCEELDNIHEKYTIVRDEVYEFEDNSILIFNNYKHKIFNKIINNTLQKDIIDISDSDGKLDEEFNTPKIKCNLHTLETYFVIHSDICPSNSYLVKNIEHFKHVICISEHVKNKLEATLLNLSPNIKIHVLENYVELQKNVIKNNTQCIKFNYVGRLSPEKNLPMLFYALGKIKDKGINNWTLNIYGDHKNEKFFNMLKNIITSIDILSNINYNGFVTNKNKLYENCDYTILPSISEGSSYALLESLAYGVPMIACKYVGDNDYRITDAINGYLFEINEISSKQLENINLLNDDVVICESNYNNILKSVGYKEIIIIRDKTNRKHMRLNKSKLLMPPQLCKGKPDKFNANVNNIANILEKAINDKLIINPQSSINKEQYKNTIVELFKST